MKNLKGAIACGHPKVAEAAEQALLKGGNVFDAIVAAQFSACVVEPVLASLGGGGYLLALPFTHKYDLTTQSSSNNANPKHIN